MNIKEFIELGDSDYPGRGNFEGVVYQTSNLAVCTGQLFNIINLNIKYDNTSINKYPDTFTIYLRDCYAVLSCMLWELNNVEVEIDLDKDVKELLDLKDYSVLDDAFPHKIMTVHAMAKSIHSDISSIMGAETDYMFDRDTIETYFNCLIESIAGIFVALSSICYLLDINVMDLIEDV